MSAVEVAVQVDHLSKKFRVFHERHQSLKQSLLNRRRGKYEDFLAIDDVTFNVPKGETFAIVGHNGSGKSTMLKCLTNILRPDAGKVTVNGSISALLELGAGFHPELSGRENVYLNAAILGVPRKEIAARFDDVVAFAELEQFIDTPVKNYSSGMFVRLGFAVAVNVSPDVLIVDEVLAVGDASFQKKCLDKIGEFRERGRTIILVTHILETALSVAQRAAWLDHGHLKMIGDPSEVLEAYSASQIGPAAVAASASGEVLLETLELFDRHGQPAANFATGDEVVVRVPLRRTTDLDTFRIELTFKAPNGTVLTHTMSADVHTGAGSSMVATYTVPSLPLLCGNYGVTAAVHEPVSGRLLAASSASVPVSVRPGTKAEHGIVRLDGHWA
jgi:ABC-2 type transport system ATP-binding protein